MIRTREDWISAGERAFREVDSFWSRTSDSQAIALARDPQSFTNAFKLPDGSGPRATLGRDRSGRDAVVGRLRQLSSLKSP